MAKKATFWPSHYFWIYCLSTWIQLCLKKMSPLDHSVTLDNYTPLCLSQIKSSFLLLSVKRLLHTQALRTQHISLKFCNSLLQNYILSSISFPLPQVHPCFTCQNHINLEKGKYFLWNIIYIKIFHAYPKNVNQNNTIWTKKFKTSVHFTPHFTPLQKQMCVCVCVCVCVVLGKEYKFKSAKTAIKRGGISTFPSVLKI